MQHIVWPLPVKDWEVQNRCVVSGGMAGLPKAHRWVVYEDVYAAHCVVAAREGLQVRGLKSRCRLLTAALCSALLPIPPSSLVGLRAHPACSHKA